MEESGTYSKVIANQDEYVIKVSVPYDLDKLTYTIHEGFQPTCKL